jgi:hypothetical protein
LSQARAVELLSWTTDTSAWRATLDLDQVMAGEAQIKAALAPFPREPGRHGTVVRWLRCDQLAGQTPRRLAKDLSEGLGRIFRRFLWDGFQLRVNGSACPARDPLLLDPRAPVFGATPFGEALLVPIDCELGQGNIIVRFSELPVASWHNLSIAEKRAKGIIKGSGVYVLRAGREVDAGWLFMGEKRRESYDDWWRCEIEVPPTLDEAMGLTFTKQQVRPCPALIEALTPIVSPIAHALNARVRLSHQTIAARARLCGTESRASEVEGRMPPLPAPAKVAPEPPPLLKRLAALQPDLLEEAPRAEVRVVEEDLGAAPVFEPLRWGRRLIVVMNRSHPFYQQAYAPLAASTEPGAAERRAHLELLWVALARAESALESDCEAIASHRRLWSDAIAELVRG